MASDDTSRGFEAPLSPRPSKRELLSQAGRFADNGEGAPLARALGITTKLDMPSGRDAEKLIRALNARLRYRFGDAENAYLSVV